MPRSVAAMMSSSVMSRSPGSSEMFGMRWNCTAFHDSAKEQPCERLLPVRCAIRCACSRVVW
ncbi:hypothetical protein D3C83_250970 [compost metagenome]